jgi:cytochrome oxidase Cu insertion factor (SCO1/SenC/PrrC family)
VKRAKGTRRISLGLAVVGLAGALSAFPSRAESEAGPAPDVTVWNEANQRVALSEELRKHGEGPVIVLPIYTRCGASCPILTRKLEKETAGMAAGIAYRVLIFSFDPTETAESLQHFRKEENVPANWTMVRAEERESQKFFDFFHYRVMTEGGVLIHPNEIFLLDRNLNWRLTLTGEDWNAAKLQERLGWMESPGPVAWAAMNPAKIAVLGVVGLFGSFVLLLGWLIFRRPDQRAEG